MIQVVDTESTKGFMREVLGKVDEDELARRAKRIIRLRDGSIESDVRKAELVMETGRVD